MADTANKLDSTAQTFVCQCLAQYKTYQETVDALKAETGIEVTIQTIHHYATSEDWRPRIDELRALWTARLSDVPLANKHARLDALSSLHDKALARKDLRTAASILEAIRRELEGPDKAAASAEIHVTLGRQGEDGGQDDPPVAPDPPADP